MESRLFDHVFVQIFPFFYWADIKSDISRFIESHHIDLFNSHNVGVDIHMSRTGIKLDAGWIVSLHGGYETVRQYIDAPFIAYVEKNVDHWLCLSEKNKTPLLEKGMADRGFLRSFNAVPDTSVDWLERKKFRNEHKIPQDAFCLMICSRAIPEKGWEIAIQVAIAASEQTKKKIHICLIGSGPMVDELRQRYAADSRILILGYVENPMRTFRSFDLAIFPSTYSGETFPLFLLECFSAGLPAISTDIGEIPHIMSAAGKPPGAVVDWTKSPEEITASMTRYVVDFIKHKKKRTSAVEAANVTATLFSMNRLADLYLELASQLSSAKG